MAQLLCCSNSQFAVVMFFLVDHPTIFLSFFFFNDTATTEIYTLSLHDALPISGPDEQHRTTVAVDDRAEVHGLKNTRAANLRSEEHTSELQSLAYLVCRLLLEKKKINKYTPLVECE